jgi:hypothetical protein
MRIIESKKRKKDKKKKKKRRGIEKFIEAYWSTLLPAPYPADMVAHEDEKISKQASRLRKENLRGKLKQTDDGFVYLDISNNFIHGFFPLLEEEEGIEKPPYFSKNKTCQGLGAHVSVISPDELEEFDEQPKIKELGEFIPFTVKQMYSTKPDGWEEMERVWFLAIDAPKLKKIRKKYNLPETYKDKGHDFHITVAVKKVK